MPTKKTAKKTVAKKTTKLVLKDSTLYIVSKRDGLFGWTPVAAYETADAAHEHRNSLERNSPLSYKAAKVTVVQLVRG